MAKQRFAGPLNAAKWPLLAAMQGRTVIQPTYDPGVRAPKWFSGTEESADLTIPQIVYCENVLPIAEGMMSVGFEQVVAATGSSTFDQVFVLRDSVENQYLYSPGDGANWVATGSPLTWASYDPIVVTDGTPVTRAYVNGRTFVCYAGVGLFEWDPGGGGSFDPVVLTLPPGVSSTDIICVGSSNNYLIISTGIDVLWSSLLDPTDFVPSTTTGAGTAIPQDVKGTIIAICGTSGGYAIYTENNVVAAQYTNNVRSPFAFREIAGAGGIDKNEHVTTESASGVQYAWTRAGLQRITLQQSENMSAEITDFIRYRRWNTYDSATKTLTTEEIGADSLQELYVKVAFNNNRYLCVSYGNTESSGRQLFKYCLVFDTVLRRWGNVKIDHVDCFCFNDANSKWDIAFLGRTGVINVLTKRLEKLPNSEVGTIILGRYQLTRQRLIQHQLTTVEGTYLNDGGGAGYPNSLALYLANSLDGQTLVAGEAMTLDEDSGQSATYDLRRTGINFNLIITGCFVLTGLLIETCDDGDI